MKHLGDITKINGHTVPIVDCIIGGSPCQDLSVAGKRAGLDGERSGLYIEQVRIVKEMRAEDEQRENTGVDIRPRYMVWENVPGALSSGTPKGEDFRIVLEELAKVKDKDAVIPMPPKGKWTTAGCIVGDGWSIAWRVLDAQFWGTSNKPLPQRRRRIALVADFGGESAPEILFVRESVSGHTEPGEQKRKGTSSDVEGSIGADDRKGELILDDQGGSQISVRKDGKRPTLRAEMHGNIPCVMESAAFCPEQSAKTRGIGYEEEIAPTLRSGVTPACVYSVENHPADSRVDIDESGTVQTLTGRMGTGGGNVPMVLALDRASFNQGKNAQYDFEVSDKGINSPLVAKGPGAVCYWDGGQIAGTLTVNNANGSQRMPDKENFNCVIQGETRYIVRRLSPLECERLQGTLTDGRI